MYIVLESGNLLLHIEQELHILPIYKKQGLFPETLPFFLLFT